MSRIEKPNKVSKKPVSFRLPDETISGLKRLTDRVGKSRPIIITVLVRRELKRFEKIDAEERVRLNKPEALH